MSTLHLRKNPPGVECFNNTSELSDQIYNLVTSPREEDDEDMALIRRAGVIHLVGWRGEPYAWISFNDKEDPLRVAESLARKLQIPLVRTENPLPTMWLEKPPDKHWGIVVRDGGITHFLIRRTIGLCSYEDELKADPRLLLIKKAAPFFQSDTEGYLYVEFWSGQETALNAAFALAEITGVPLDMKPEGERP